MEADKRNDGAGSGLAVLFPGIGYTCDKPLLYYSGKLARLAGYEVMPVPYGNFPPKVRGDRERLRESIEIAYAQAETLLADIRWAGYARIAFIGKSIGTAVAARYAHARSIPARLILLTPLAETFHCPCPHSTAFHGTADPWASNEEIANACRARDIPLYLTEGANHSLETGDPLKDIRILLKTMETVRAALEGPV